MELQLSPKQTNLDNAGMVHFKCRDRGTSHRTHTEYHSIVITPAKMTMPGLTPGIEDSNASTTDRIFGHYATPLCSVTNRARETQVIQVAWTSRRSRNNVIYFERLGAELLLELAVFAEEPGSFGHLVAKLS